MAMSNPTLPEKLSPEGSPATSGLSSSSNEPDSDNVADLLLAISPIWSTTPMRWVRLS